MSKNPRNLTRLARMLLGRGRIFLLIGGGAFAFAFAFGALAQDGEGGENAPESSKVIDLKIKTDAQEQVISQRWIFTPILALNRERLYRQSKAGQKIEETRVQALKDLREENERIDAELALEEQKLTQMRDGLSSEAFKRLANEFDAKVVALRADQTEKTIEINKRAEASRRAFFEQILPILQNIARDNGALAILELNDFILSASAIDITDIAIARIDAIFAQERK